MTRIELETWDQGRLTANTAFAEILRRKGWRTFDAIWTETADAAVAKKLRTDRITLRFTLSDDQGPRVFYIKRHSRSSWKEYIKPLLRLTWPILGARNEWHAILGFHEAGIPTMTPVAFGESASNSFLITEGLVDCVKLSELTNPNEQHPPLTIEMRSRLIREIAQTAKSMHSAGFHHQDFYLGHLMLSQTFPGKIFVIDLGRVCHQKQISRRWIVKDLAQLDYSGAATSHERLRFLREYLGRPIQRSDRHLIDLILSKHAAIARHSQKNRL